MDPPTLHISLLGGFSLRQGTEPVVVESGRIRALIAWLALHAEGAQPRQRVAAALWPESPEGQARTNLRNLLHQLRRSFPEIELYLDTAGSLLEWLPGATVHVDVAAFEDALSAAHEDRAGTAPSLLALEEALDLYRGPLLPECYEPWIADEQARLAHLHRSGLEALLERYLEQENFPKALDIGGRIMRCDPLSERAHRARITALAALGDRAGALRAYHECESLLEAELGVAPSLATRQVYEAALRAGEPAPQTSDTAARNTAARPVTGFEARGRTVPNEALPRETATAADGRAHSERVAVARGGSAFVGRMHERAALRRTWARTMESTSCMVLVSGDPGIGKTRLVQSLAEWLERQGHTSVHSRAYPTLGALAYGPLVGWLRSSSLAATISHTSGAIRTELARLLPELESAVSAADAEMLTEAERRRRIHDAVIATFAASSAPSTLIVDDLQWSDQETIDLLHALVLRSPRPLLLVATVRTGEVGPGHPATSLATSLSAAGRLERIELEGLTEEQTGALACDLTGETVSDEAVRDLHRETEGNPLFIVEMVRSGQLWVRTETRGRVGEALHPRIRAVIEARLTPLSSEARTVTQLAAAVGREFSLPLLLRVATLDETATLRGLDELWRRRLVRDRSDGSYDFTHDKIREVAYRTTSPVRRRTYHARIAAVLEEACTGGAALPEATPDQVALHHDRGGAVALAIDWYRRAARTAAEVSALDVVRQLLDRALELVERLPPGAERDRDELEMRLSFGSVLVALEGYGRARTVETYERARNLCVKLDRPVTPPILRALALAALARGDLDQGTGFGQELVGTADREGDDVARVEGAYVIGVMAFWRGDLAGAERWLDRALELYRPERHRDHVLLYAQDPRVVCLARLAWTLWHRGRVWDALARRDEAIELAERQGDPFGLAYALWFTLFIPLEQGDVARLDAQSRALARVSAAHRLPYMETVAEGFLGYLQAVSGEPREGIARMRATLADPRWHGMEYVLKLQTFYLLARTAAAAGDARTARDTVQEALDYAGPGASIWKAQLQHLRARLIGVDDRTGDRAVAAFREALETARSYGSAWAELGTAVEFGRWCLDRGANASAEACRDLERALVPYIGAPELPAVAAARILLERLTREDPE